MRSEGGKTVNVVLFLLPTAIGAVLALVCIGLRRFLPKRLKLAWLAPFLAAFGLGTGVAAMALDARGLRLPMIEWVQNAKERHYRQAVQKKMEQEARARRNAGARDAIAD